MLSREGIGRMVRKTITSRIDRIMRPLLIPDIFHLKLAFSQQDGECATTTTNAPEYEWQRHAFARDCPANWQFAVGAESAAAQGSLLLPERNANVSGSSSSSQSSSSIRSPQSHKGRHSKRVPTKGKQTMTDTKRETEPSIVERPVTSFPVFAVFLISATNFFSCKERKTFPSIPRRRNSV